MAIMLCRCSWCVVTTLSAMCGFGFVMVRDVTHFAITAPSGLDCSVQRAIQEAGEIKCLAYGVACAGKPSATP
eukprot:2647140-Amphidinium_carterae.1